MTKALPFTQAGIARRISGIRQAGLHPLGVTTDGTVLIGDKPLDATSLALAPLLEHDTPASKWEDEGT